MCLTLSSGFISGERNSVRKTTTPKQILKKSQEKPKNQKCLNVWCDYTNDVHTKTSQKRGVTLLIKCNSVWMAHITACYVLPVLQTSLIFRRHSLSLSLNKFQEITLVTSCDARYPLVLANTRGDVVGQNCSGFALRAAASAGALRFALG